tara:strand:+ start:245 stop:553 length:309 start_codon:yes stop_codon:yes gene_type:complete
MPRSRITKVLKDYIQIDHKSGFVITKPKNLMAPVPLFCNLCSLSMSGELDKAYYEKYSCCSSCGMKWADMNQENWENGWRPEKEEIANERDRRVSDFVSFSL